jgi:hypothetical protein
MAVVVVRGEASAGLDLEHGGREAETLSHVGNPRNKRVVDKARDGAPLLCVSPDHLREHHFADELQLRQVLVQVLAPRLVLVSAIFEEFEPDEAFADRGRLVGDVAGFPHLFADAFWCGEGNKQTHRCQTLPKS